MEKDRLLQLAGIITESDDKITAAVKEFFMENPNPSDKQVHAFAEDHKIDPHKLEEVIYKLLSSLLNGK